MIEKEPELICSSENKLSLRATEKNKYGYAFESNIKSYT